VAAVKRSIYHWEFIDSLAGKIDEKALKEAQSAHDAVAAYSIVYKTLGLDEKFIQKVHASRRK
jgi:xylose isomerase